MLYHFDGIKSNISIFIFFNLQLKHKRQIQTKVYLLNNSCLFFSRIAREAGVERFIHLSSLNVEANPKDLFVKGGSEWLKSKYEGELRVRDAFPNATIIRPADIYGSEDRFLRYYAHIWRRQFRSMPLWHKGEKTVKQPVYVSDVAQAIINAAKDPDSAGRIYQAVG